MEQQLNPPEVAVEKNETNEISIPSTLPELQPVVEEKKKEETLSSPFTSITDPQVEIPAATTITIQEPIGELQPEASPPEQTSSSSSSSTTAATTTVQITSTTTPTTTTTTTKAPEPLVYNPFHYKPPIIMPELGLKRPPTAEEKHRAREAKYKRHREILMEDKQKAPTFFNSLKVSLHSTGHRLDNIVSKIGAVIVEETRADLAEKSAERFSNLKLTEQEKQTLGEFIIDFHVSAVISENPPNVAVGWLFVTSKCLIFDGATNPGTFATPKLSQPIRFTIEINKIVSFTSCNWEANPNSIVPIFVQVHQKLKESIKDAVLIFDTEGLIHQFFEFTRFGVNWTEEFIIDLEKAWRTIGGPVVEAALKAVDDASNQQQQQQSQNQQSQETVANVAPSVQQTTTEQQKEKEQEKENPQQKTL